MILRARVAPLRLPGKYKGRSAWPGARKSADKKGLPKEASFKPAACAVGAGSDAVVQVVFQRVHEGAHLDLFLGLQLDVGIDEVVGEHAALG